MPAHGSFHGTGCELNSQNSHEAGSEGVSVLPATCLGSELCGIYLLSNPKTGGKAQCVCQLCSKKRRVCNSARNLWHNQKGKTLICQEPKDYDLTCLILKRSMEDGRVYSPAFCFSGCSFGGRFYSLEDTWHPDLGEPFGVMHCVQCSCEPVSTHCTHANMLTKLTQDDFAFSCCGRKVRIQHFEKW